MGRGGSSAGFPPYASLIFSGVKMDDEHVTVWEPATGKTVAGNAAPYRKNLPVWLKAHPGWEEKADELKSSKRRSAARRAKLAASSFAALCAHKKVAQALLDDVSLLTDPADSTPLASDWSADEYVRLEEALVRVGEQLLLSDAELDRLAEDRWETIVTTVGGSKTQISVMNTAKYILDRGISSHKEIMSGDSGTSSERSPELTEPSFLGSLSSGSSGLASEQNGRAAREPRVTVWDPATGRTVSGNAAPCKRNVTAWIAAHPGWEVKRDEHLSASRRAKKLSLAAFDSDEDAKEDTDYGEHSATEPGSPPSSVLSDALEGLLNLSGQGYRHATTSEDSDSPVKRLASWSSSISDEEASDIGVKRCAPEIREEDQRPSHRSKLVS
ncbi:hypothetical protein NDN08_006358 [Rhodosorus marinus]|uniref:BRK domain-containing protein n=1 Tax=Rhodosorus marinus TaxID=101924 RepID=A0AAV8UN90_9RHOD|nr:hypothetical protein NDN08_006358 [Rhodosorus marinus]